MSTDLMRTSLYSGAIVSFHTFIYDRCLVPLLGVLVQCYASLSLLSRGSGSYLDAGSVIGFLGWEIFHEEELALFGDYFSQ